MAPQEGNQDIEGKGVLKRELEHQSQGNLEEEIRTSRARVTSMWKLGPRGQRVLKERIKTSHTNGTLKRELGPQGQM